MSNHFHCEVCDEHRPIDHLIEVAGKPVCRLCVIEGVVSLFNAAFESETNYPVKYGADILDITDFATFFTADFLIAYAIRTREYETPVPDRLYCNNRIEVTQDDSSTSYNVCGQFLGTKKVSEEGKISSTHCSGCSSDICMLCANKITDGIDNHACPSPTADAFEGQIRGRDFQICPGPECSIKVHLRDACNHMTCICGTEFCYICGEEALGYSEHWGFGSCPRFGFVREEMPRRETGVVGTAEQTRLSRHLMNEVWFVELSMQQLGPRAFEDLPARQALTAFEEQREWAQNETQPQIDDMERTELHAALAQAIRQTPQGAMLQLCQHDADQLLLAERRCDRLPETSPVLRSLIHNLNSEIRVYYRHFRQVEGEPQLAQDDPEAVEGYRQIQALVAQLGPNPFDEGFANLEIILETYLRAWDGDLEFVRQRWTAVEMITLAGRHGQILSEERRHIEDQGIFTLPFEENALGIIRLTRTLNRNIEEVYGTIAVEWEVRMQDMVVWIRHHDEILSIAQGINAATWARYPRVRVVFDTFVNVWNRVVDEHGRFIRPAAYVAEV